jgi:hypothetical protein
MARSRTKHDVAAPRFLFSVSAGVFTGLLSFFITNCLLPPTAVDKVRALIWLPRQCSETPQPDSVAASMTSPDGTAVMTKAELTAASDRKDLPDPRQSVHIRYGSKDELIITLSPGSKNETPPTPANPPTSISTSKRISTNDSPWIPVGADGGAR